MDLNRFDQITSIISHFTIIIAMMSLIFQYLQSRVSNRIASKDRFIACTAKYIKIQEILLSNKDLAPLNAAIYRERLDKTKLSPESALGPEIALAGMMFQLMEDVWLMHDLDINKHDSLYSGWHHLFQDWMSTHAIASKWDVLKLHFGSKFIYYIETNYVKRTEAKGIEA